MHAMSEKEKVKFFDKKREKKDPLDNFTSDGYEIQL